MYVYAKRRKRQSDDPELADVRNKDLDDLESGRAAEEMNPDDDPNRDKKGGDGGSDLEGSGPIKDTDEAGIDGEPFEATTEYPYQTASDALTTTVVTGIPPSPDRPKGSDSSSAGESGWSSSAGLSSLNTASFDAGTDDGLLPGSPQRLMATIGAANMATQMADSVQRDAKPTFIPVDNTTSGSYDPSSPLHIHSGPVPAPGNQVTREDLNAAIEAGDWAMVGATAALLADSPADYSLSESEGPNRSFASSNLSSEGDSANLRTRELDRLVEIGDWEGIVLAAAQLQGQDVQSEEESNTVDSKSESWTQGSRSTMRQEEIRAEVERLVRRVVPDEIDNIDEMMIQFSGREEELIETLRTMQERSVAQRARAAVQKTAKQEAKSKARANAPIPGSSTGSASPTAQNIALKSSHSSSASSESEPLYYGSANNSSNSDFSSSSSSVSNLGMTSMDPQSVGSPSKSSNRSSLELAIERGDWRAVGEAAAMMGDGSSGVILPNESGDVSLSSSFTGESASGRQSRVSYLDSLIAQGDWAGIVAAAGHYQATDDQGSGKEEEQKALAQAEMWTKIANQSKQDSEAQGAASDAADWAIERSLEQKMKRDAGEVSDYPVQKPRIADESDESV